MPTVSQARSVRSAPSSAVCAWDNPGLSPFMGDVVGAVDRYQDIPPAVRTRLKERMRVRQYDEFVTIRRDSIDGANAYEPQISEMHFGDGRVCGKVDRSRWTPQMTERGLVYCESGHCVLVPTVCRNVSRISMRPQTVAPALAGGGGSPADDSPLEFEAPGAGGGGGGDSFEQVASGPPPSSVPLLPPPAPPPVPPMWPPYVPPPPYLPPPPIVPPPVPPPVPEPHAAWLLLAGLAVLAYRRTRGA